MIDVGPGNPTTARSWRNAYHDVVSDTGEGAKFGRGFVDSGPGNIIIACASHRGGRKRDGVYPIWPNSIAGYGWLKL